MVLLWNIKSKDKGKNGKFDPLWLSIYEVAKRYEMNGCHLMNLDGKFMELCMLDQDLKHYFS